MFSVVFTPSSPSSHGNVWLLPVISLLLTNTASPMRACLLYNWRGLVGAKKEDERGPLSICRARICKRLSCPAIDSKESIPSGCESIPGLLKRFTNSGSEQTCPGASQTAETTLTIFWKWKRSSETFKLIQDKRFDVDLFILHFFALIFRRCERRGHPSRTPINAWSSPLISEYNLSAGDVLRQHPC